MLRPSVIARVGVFYAPHEHVAAATTFAHPFSALAADDTTKVAVTRVLEWCPSRTRAHWQELLRKWPARSSALARRERLLHEAMDTHVAKVLEGKNLLLLREILHESGFRKADDLFNSMSKGFDVIGDLAPTSQFEPQPRRRALSKETLWSRSRQVRSGILSSVGASGDAELDDKVTKATKEGLEAGWLFGPFTEAELYCRLGLWLQAPRFGFRQGREGSLRVVDDYSIAGHNNGTSVAEKVDVGGVDVIVGIARCLLSAEPSSDFSLPLGDGGSCSGRVHPEWTAEGLRVKGRVWDLSKAYRQLARNPAHASFTVIATWDSVRQCTVLYEQPVSPSVQAYRCRTSAGLPERCGTR